MMTDSPKPLPCPFCGAIEKRKHVPTIGNTVNLEIQRKKHGLYVACLECGARGPIAWSKNGFVYSLARALRHRDHHEIQDLTGTEYSLQAEEALRLWNQRASVETTADNNQVGDSGGTG